MSTIKISTLIMIFLFVSLVQAQIGQQGTAFPENGKDGYSYVFLLAANNDLYGIKKSGIGSNFEVHILNSSDGYKTFKLKAGFPIQQTKDEYDFLLAPNNDLMFIKKTGTGTKKTEVHILTASSNYQQFSLQTGTPLPETNKSYSFLMDAERNLYVINKQGLRSTTIQILSATSNYQTTIFAELGLPLSQTDERFSFLLDADKNLFVIIKQDTGQKVMVVFKRDSNYQIASPLSGTVLGLSGDNFQYLINPQNDLFGIKTGQTGTNSTEVHILSSISRYSQFGLTPGPTKPNPTVATQPIQSKPTVTPKPNVSNPTTTQTVGTSLYDRETARIQGEIANMEAAIKSGKISDPNLDFMTKIQAEAASLEADIKSGKISDPQIIEAKRKEFLARVDRQIKQMVIKQAEPMFTSMKAQVTNDPNFPAKLKEEFIKGIDILITMVSAGLEKPDMKVKYFDRVFASGIKIFEGTALQGKFAAFGVGTFNANNGPLNGIGNDTASSVQVPTGYIAKLCSEEGNNRQGSGQCEEYGEGTHNLKYPRTASWVNVRLIDIPQLPEVFQTLFEEGKDLSTMTFGEVGVKIFDGRDFQGKSAIFGNGTFNANNGPLNGMGNDSASSVIVPKGFQVRICELEGRNNEGAGNCEEYGAGKYNLKYDKQASWVKVWIP